MEATLEAPVETAQVVYNDENPIFVPNYPRTGEIYADRVFIGTPETYAKIAAYQMIHRHAQIVRNQWVVEALKRAPQRIKKRRGVRQ